MLATINRNFLTNDGTHSQNCTDCSIKGAAGPECNSSVWREAVNRRTVPGPRLFIVNRGKLALARFCSSLRIHNSAFTLHPIPFAIPSVHASILTPTAITEVQTMAQPH